MDRKLAESANRADFYETELLEQFADTDDAVEFFACLDQQLSKVNKFYRMKQGEFLDRGRSLKKQMEILIELKSALRQKQTEGSCMQEDTSISGTVSCDEDSVKDRTDTEEELENSSVDVNKDYTTSSESPNSIDLGNSMGTNREDWKFKPISSRVVQCQGKSLTIHIPVTNPTQTFSAISYLLRDDLKNQTSKKSCPEGKSLHINKTKLRHVEKMIRGAFIELYKGLGYLKTYRNLNMLAFAKILKKFDKVSNKHVLPVYLRVVESSYFNNSDKALNLSDEVEELFVKNFAEDDRRKAMKYLRPTQKKESHAVTFFIEPYSTSSIRMQII